MFLYLPELPLPDYSLSRLLLQMEQYNVTGMTCAACQARVEKVVSKVPGVTSVSVSLLTNSMGVEGTALSTDIPKKRYFLLND